MRQKLSSITQRLRLPLICILCNQFHRDPHAVCHACIALLKPLGTRCTRCAYPLFDSLYLTCGHCIASPPAFDTAFIAYSFDEPLRSLLHQFKYHNGLYLTSFLGELMLHAWNSSSNVPDCLIPVPMHPRRIQQRGFNQAAVLAKFLAHALALPYDLISCSKVVNTAPQAQLNKQRRQRNLRHVFAMAKTPYQHVVLIDDLLTTGSTAHELARMLKKSGVLRVDVWCCARTIHKKN